MARDQADQAEKGPVHGFQNMTMSNGSVPAEDLKACQVSTPPALAMAMVGALVDVRGEEWLEPCVGSGSLLEALAQAGVPKTKVRGLDLDPRPGEGDRHAQVLRGAEFIAWAGTTTETFDKVVANPPYMALSRCRPEVREAALRLPAPLGLSVRSGANCWCAFLAASLRVLRKGGSLCFLLPAAWEHADYAAPFRHSIAHHFQRSFTYRSMVPLFQGVQEGSVVLLAHGFMERQEKTAAYDFERPEDLVSAIGRPEHRGRPTHEVEGIRHSESPVDVVPFGTEVSFGIGAVTGDSKFFLMTEERRKELGLPLGALDPVLTRAKHLRGAFVDQEDWKALRDEGERVWLFRPTDEDMAHPSVKRYLELPLAEGGCRRSALKVASRTPWYRTPLPSEVDGFVSGMSTAGPWITLREFDRLTATNTLYTVRFRNARSSDEKAAWAMALVTSVARESMATFVRRYADGLMKFEPRDLARIRVPVPPRTTGAAPYYRGVISSMVAEGPAAAVRAADLWFSQEHEAGVRA